MMVREYTDVPVDSLTQDAQQLADLLRAARTIALIEAETECKMEAKACDSGKAVVANNCAARIGKLRNKDV